MKRKQLVRRFLPGVWVLLLVFAFTNLSFAQDQELPQQQYQLSYIQVNPGMGTEFEELLKNLIPTFKGMGLSQMWTFKTANFGMADKYLFVTPLQDPEVMDAELASRGSDVPTVFVAAMSALQRTVDSIHDFQLIPQTDLNIPPADDYDIKLFVNITIGIAPGRDEDFKKGMKEVVAALGKTNIKGVLVGKVGLGGNLDQYIVTSLYDSFKDMTANMPAVQKEMAKLDLTPFTGVIYYRESEVLVRIPELCIEAE